MPLSAFDRISQGFLAVVSAAVSGRCLYVLGTRLRTGETSAVDLIFLVLSVCFGYCLYASLYTLLRGRRLVWVESPLRGTVPIRHGGKLGALLGTANRLRWWGLIAMCAAVTARAIFFLVWKLYLGVATPATFVALPVGAAAAYCGYWLYAKKLKKVVPPPA
jgi:hypothetical protein